MIRQNFFPVGFSSPVSSPHGFLIVYSFQGINEKIKGYDGGIPSLQM